MSLSIKGKGKLFTPCGGFLTLVSTAILILLLYDLLNRSVNRLDPIIVKNKTPNDLPQLNITDKNFAYALYNQADETQIEELERKLVGSSQHYDTETKQVTNYEMKMCGKQALRQWDVNSLKSNLTYWCLPEGTNIQLKNPRDILKFEISFCENLKNSNCHNYDYINNNLNNNIQMHYLINSSSVDLMDYSNPVKPLDFSGISNSNLNTWSRNYINLKNIEIETDYGLFITRIDKTLYQTVSNVNYETLFINKNDSDKNKKNTTIFSHILTLENYKDTYKRSYIKVHNVLCLIGGMIKLLEVMFAGILNYVATPDIVDLFSSNYKSNLFKYSDNMDKDVSSHLEKSSIMTINPRMNVR